ncbi:MAG: hypothetical protein C4567_10185 [Deltaproteobacteria bacterium]|nr:MAG: hypothetical protein C4567_10185 [Deltaproteobacteria bacterium]
MAKYTIAAGVLSVMLLSGLALADYPNVGPYPTPMGNAFQQQGAYNADGTLAANPVIDAGAVKKNGIAYSLRKLTTGDTLTFNGTVYTVYSAIPNFMTIDQAYRQTAAQYDPQALENIDFVIPATLNRGRRTAVSAAASLSPYTNELAYLTQPSTDAQYFIPNLCNAAGKHNGLTEHIFWTVDAYKGQPGYQPNGPGYHLTGYGWAQESQEVNQPFAIYQLPMDGGGPCGTQLVQAAATPFNYWLQLFSNQGNVKTSCYNAITGLATYPFPDPVWLKNGIYTHFHPMPGFQRNLLRYYTAWGSFNLLNNTSGLFVRNDGSVELPAYHNGRAYKFYPLVIQNWDATQRYTVINQTNNVIPLSLTDYPGQEKYFASNTFLPGKAGVLPAYKNYQVYDNTGLEPRQPDLFVGLKGDSPQDVMFWDQAPTGNPPVATEPGGQANKPYMMGADSSIRGGVMTHSCRLQSANSFFVARLGKAQLQGKLYQAEIYVDPQGDGNWELVARLSYRWKPWTISDAGAWEASPDNLGAGVPSISAVNPNYMNLINTSVGTSWSAAGRAMGWTGRLYQTGDANSLGAAPQIYTISLSFNNLPNVRCLVVFK